MEWREKITSDNLTVMKTYEGSFLTKLLGGGKLIKLTLIYDGEVTGLTFGCAVVGDEWLALGTECRHGVQIGDTGTMVVNFSPYGSKWVHSHFFLLSRHDEAVLDTNSHPSTWLDMECENGR